MTLIERYAGFAVDLDGVVWRGDEMLDGGRDGLRAIIEAAKPLLLLTNNGSYKPGKVVERLAGEGLKISEDQLLTSTIVAKTWITEHGLAGKPAFVLGPRDISSQLEDLVELLPVERSQVADIVIVGRYIDLSYEGLAAAANSIRDGAAFVALNNDPIMPVENGFVPGTGAILAAVVAASGGDPVVLGKPEAPMMEAASKILGPDGILMAGDRLQSDIAGAHRNGWDSALVLSGVAVDEPDMDPRPTYVLESLGDLINPSVAAVPPTRPINI
ncbi:MAG: HAD-IIA family hydrolase [Actinomycetota bacterium]